MTEPQPAPPSPAYPVDPANALLRLDQNSHMQATIHPDNPAVMVVTIRTATTTLSLGLDADMTDRWLAVIGGMRRRLGTNLIVPNGFPIPGVDRG